MLPRFFQLSDTFDEKTEKTPDDDGEDEEDENFVLDKGGSDGRQKRKRN